MDDCDGVVERDGVTVGVRLLEPVPVRDTDGVPVRDDDGV